jgi:hypothetical protein
MLKIVEKVPDEELNQPCRYIPHHPVIKELPDQQRKIRIVFDASAKSGNEASLNECVEEGPNLFTDLLGILLRFRRHEVGIICDVEKAFLQIELHPDDRDHVRYMWYEDVNQVSQFSVPTIYRLCRVPFGVTSSPFLLNATIRHHLQLKESQYVDTVQVIRRSLYVDDLVLSLPSIPFTQAVIKDSVEIFESMKMRLSKWHTSHPQVLADMDKIHLSKCTKVLGIQWDPQNDQLFLVFPFANKVVRTKRDLASVCFSLYDPLGFVSPVILAIKLLLQETWRRDTSWDEELDPVTLKQAEKVCKNLVGVHQIRIPRFIRAFTNMVELHGFGDASTKAYCAVIYVRSLDSNIPPQFLISKTKLAPIKKVTLPRLELMAAEITSKLLYTSAMELQIPQENCFGWCDSKIVLCWIHFDRKWKEFVSNRVSKIHSLLPKQNWFHISGKDNPADFGTRGCSVEELSQCDRWWHGPKNILSTSEIGATVSKTLSQEEKEALNSEVLKEKSRCCPVIARPPMYDIRRSSSYNRCIAVMFYVFKFIYRCRRKCGDDADLRNEAEIHLIRACQERNFSQEIEQLREQIPLSVTSKLYPLRPFIDECSMLRAQGRIAVAMELSYDE